MSKESFGMKINNSLYKKIKAIENCDLDNFLERDEYFELGLCLTYMSLSKEKIIKKDMKNNDRMGRLTKFVDDKEIDKLFSCNFCSEVPVIIKTRENNNLWILDNIRDSIMHGMFEVDESRKCFNIDNDQYDREFKAEIPFSWFIEYAKNDILKKRNLDKYTVRGFFPDKKLIGKKYFKLKVGLYHTIVYNVRLSGNKFNVNNVEKRVRELFLEFSNMEISFDDIRKYKDKLDKINERYFDEEYLISFYLVRDQVIAKLKEEYPEMDVNIYIDNKKKKLENIISKKNSKGYKNYDLMIADLDNLLKSKSISLLTCLTNIISNFDLVNGYVDCKSKYFDISKFNYILNNDDCKYTEYDDANMLYNNNLNILRSICISVLGISTLVINHENLYNQYFLGQNPFDYGISAMSKKFYLEYVFELKKLTMKLLDKEIQLADKKKNYDRCNDINMKNKISIMLNNIQGEINNINLEISGLSNKLNFQGYEDKRINEDKDVLKIERVLNSYFEHFYMAKNINDKKKIRKIISKLIDKKNELEFPYMYGYCYKMEDALNIIRNSFSHVGRTSMGVDRGINTIIILNDYDNNNVKSGVVFTSYFNLLNLIDMPLKNNKKKSLIK